jgi:hypothetical protein
MTTTQDLLLDAFGRVQELVHGIVDGLSADDLVYRADPDANTIAWLVWHLTRIQDDHVAEIADRIQVWQDGPWAEQIGFTGDLNDTGYGHTSEQVAAIRPATAEPLLAYHDAVADRSIEYAATITPDELDRIIDRSYDPPVTVGVRLVSVLSDCMQHTGQAGYVRGLYARQRDD